MGCYDTVWLKCPECGAEYGAQSMSGECRFGEYKLSLCPPDVIQDINRHAPFICIDCETQFRVEFTIPPPIASTVKV
jgi:hypothetical protein